MVKFNYKHSFKIVSFCVQSGISCGDKCLILLINRLWSIWMKRISQIYYRSQIGSATYNKFIKDVVDEDKHTDKLYDFAEPCMEYVLGRFKTLKHYIKYDSTYYKKTLFGNVWWC